MNFGKFDMMILVSMSLAVIGMSFVFPAMGLTTMNEAEEGDIPTFNSSADDFDFAGEFPDRPGTPSQGDLEVSYQDGDDRTLQSGDEEVRISALDTTTQDPDTLDIDVHLTHYDANGNATQETVNLPSEGDTGQFEAFDYDMGVEWVNTQTDRPNANDTAIVRYTIDAQPSGQVWYDRIPVVGSVFGVGEQLAGIVGWIGSIIYWIVAFFITILVNVFFALFDTVVFTASLMHWLISTYFSVVSAAGGFATVFVLTPGILLFLIFLKLTFITISLLWIG